MADYCKILLLIFIALCLAGIARKVDEVLPHMDAKLSEIREMYYQEQRAAKGFARIDSVLWDEPEPPAEVELVPPEELTMLHFTLDPSAGMNEVWVYGTETYYTEGKIDSLVVRAWTDPPLQDAEEPGVPEPGEGNEVDTSPVLQP